MLSFPTAKQAPILTRSRAPCYISVLGACPADDGGSHDDGDADADGEDVNEDEDKDEEKDNDGIHDFGAHLNGDGDNYLLIGMACSGHRQRRNPVFFCGFAGIVVLAVAGAPLTRYFGLLSPLNRI